MAEKRTLDDWLSWLETQHPKAIDMGLDRVGEVARRLQLNGLGCPVFTVGGTNGKGSTVATLVSIFRAAGKQVGAYTSPHLLRFNERIALNGEPVSDAYLLDAFAHVEAARAEISLTYFEFTTLAAFVIFAQAGLDVVVLEVGLGGRLDAVNVIDADVAVITSIGIDHTEYLGDTRERIAREKAGIFRAGRIAICGEADPPSTLTQAAHDLGIALPIKHRDFSFSDQGALWSFSADGETWSDLPKPQLALSNAATALMAIRRGPITVPLDAIRQGLAHAELMGRLQRVMDAPFVLLDVAHNPQGAAFLMQQLPVAAPGQRTLAVFAMLADKDISGVIEACLGRIDEWYVASLTGSRAAKAEDILPLLRERGCVCAGSYATVSAALQAARQRARPVDRILVFGSFYTVAAAQQALAPSR